MTPTTVEDARSAWHVLRGSAVAGEPYRLALLDAMMPEVDGLSLAERIRSDEALADLPIIVLSSAGQQGDAARCRALGATYLTKPVKQSDLLRTIEAVLACGGGTTGSAARPQESLQPAPAPERLRVLVAEDSPVNQALATRLLAKLGHEAVVVGDGREALEALDRDCFDLVLMDVQMPELDGLEATALLRRRESETGAHVPVVAMTAHAMRGDRERCLAAGCDGYVSKPMRLRDLADAIRDVLPGPDPERVAPEAPPAEPAVGPEHAGAVFDRDAALAESDGDVELLHELARIFLEDSPHMIGAVRAAVAAGDPEQLWRAAHKLKGSVANFAAPRVVETALRLEECGRGERLAAAVELVDELEILLADLSEGLTALVAAEPAAVKETPACPSLA
jgi:CheY-like chemotaxis protein/HPt (histidine-containing phosphotransfer) domain-containing protein